MSFRPTRRQRWLGVAALAVVGVATWMAIKTVHGVSIATVHASSQQFCNEYVALEGTVIDHGQQLLNYTLADDTGRISIGISTFMTLPALGSRVRSLSSVECGRGPTIVYALHEQFRFSR